MKMIQAIVRPEREREVIAGLERAGFYALTKFDVLGRGRQRGIEVGDMTYDEIAKVMLLVVVEDPDVEKAVGAIEKHARTGNFGDGRVFVLDVADTRVIRSGERGLGP